MKILVVTPYYHPKIGGLEMYARQLGIALHDLEKCEIVVVTSNNEHHKTVVDTVDGMNVHRLGVWFKLSNTPVNLFWPIMIRRIICSEKPDVILAHTPVPSMADAAALAAGRTPFVLVYHASTLLKGDDFLFNCIATLYSFYERVTLSRAHKILAVSEYVKQQLGPRLASKVAVVPNAVWDAQIVSRSQPKPTNFLFVGSLDRTHAWKGLDLTIRAMAEYKHKYASEFTFTIMGDGNDRARYEAHVEKHDLQDEVIFLGAKTGKEKDAAFLNATALVMYPTTANDAFPTVMLEAWARSVPVIAAAIGPIPSLINDQVDGYLVEPKKPAILADVLNRVATSTAKARDIVAKNAMRRTSDAYTWEKQAATVVAIMKDLL